MSNERPPYTANRFAWQRRRSRQVKIGSLYIGGNNPVAVQSMCTAPTQDVAACIAQTIGLAEAGCQMVRITAPGVADARALAAIRKGLDAAGWRDLPLCADIHFMPAAAMEAIEHVEKVRINPGNFADSRRSQIFDEAAYQEAMERVETRLRPLIQRAQALGRALRIGVNHGSLSERIVQRYGDSPPGMVESALEYIRIAESMGFHDLVVSMKSSNPKVMVAAYRLLCARLDAEHQAYPLHLGVTEAGGGLDGRVKGASGIGSLLEDGIGDTIRVSLSEDPLQEIPVARALVERYQPPPFLAQGIAQPPPEHIDPYVYQRRSSDLIELGQGLRVGRLRPPLVLVPRSSQEPQSPAATPDLLVDDAQAWDPATQNPALCLLHRDAAACPAQLVLLDLAETAPEEALRSQLQQVPAQSLVGIRSPGQLGATRAYRLLAAMIDAIEQDAQQGRDAVPQRPPIVLTLAQDDDPLALSAMAAALLVDGIGDALYLPHASQPCHLAFTILQAVKARSTRTDYVACPSCGRTRFDLVSTTAHVQEATQHLPGITIAVMGCIVNGPGEMADADFGFVGSGPGKVDLYHGREKVRSNIPYDQARQALIDLIKEHGLWVDPPS